MARPRPSLLKKLGISGSNRVWVRGTIPQVLLGELSAARPDVLTAPIEGPGRFDVLVVGRRDDDLLGPDLEDASRRLAEGGTVWVVWSKVISMRHRLTEAQVREVAGSVGLSMGEIVPLTGRWVAVGHRHPGGREG